MAVPRPAGIDAPYEPPLAPEIVLTPYDSSGWSALLLLALRMLGIALAAQRVVWLALAPDALLPTAVATALPVQMAGC